jgi:hypothetical protein
MNNLAEARIIPPTFRKPNNQKLPVALYFTEIGTLEILELSTSSGGEMRFRTLSFDARQIFDRLFFPWHRHKPARENLSLLGYLRELCRTLSN